MNGPRIISCLMIIFFTGFAVSAQDFATITEGDLVEGGGNSGGSSWIDFNNDNLLDLYISNGNQQEEPNFLYQNQGNGTFTSISTGPLVTDQGPSIGSAWGDFDNDGDPDLYVVNRALENGQKTKNFFYVNGGDPDFGFSILSGDIVTEETDGNMASWVDIENDGDLDLFLLNFGSDNMLYRNDEGTLNRVAESTILKPSASISNAWCDFNDDGFQDLFIANAAGERNFLYTNNGNGSFSEVTTGLLVNEAFSTTGCSWGDYNNDGYADLFVANFLNSENSLFSNEGPPDYGFVAIKGGSIVTEASSSVGSSWGDLDNDGDLDLYVGNASGQTNFVFINEGGSAFTKKISGDIVNTTANTFGVSLADIDQDGDLDAFATNIDGQNNEFYRNQGNSNSWINILCKGVNSNKNAIGASVGAEATISGEKVKQMRFISSHSGYNSQNSLEVEFGFGDATVVNSLYIRWPSGAVDSYTNVAVNTFYVAEENGDLKERLLPDMVTGTNSTLPMVQGLRAYPNPFGTVTTFELRLDRGEEVMVIIRNLFGSEVRRLKEGFLPSGPHRIQWDGTGNTGSPVRAGVYLYEIQTLRSFHSGRVVIER